MTQKEMNKIIKEYNSKIEINRSRLFRLKSNPTIIDGPDLFLLNKPSELIEISSNRTYCDRVVIDNTFTKEEIINVCDQMIDALYNSPFRAGTQLLKLTFRYPGIKDNYIRARETPNTYEIRLYAEGASYA